MQDNCRAFIVKIIELLSHIKRGTKYIHVLKTKSRLTDFKGRAMLDYPAFGDNKEAFPFHSS